MAKKDPSVLNKRERSILDYIEKQGIESKEQLKDAFGIFSFGNSINSEDLPFDV